VKLDARERLATVAWRQGFSTRERMGEPDAG
jgi:hypothetical protein